jgi:phosphatidylglycerophosphatase A
VSTAGVRTVDAPPGRRAGVRFMLSHPAHVIAMGFGSGLAPLAAGTVGTLWAWAVFLLLNTWLTEWQWALLLAASSGLGWWACTRCAQALGQSDPGAIVWDEVLAFWVVLWLLMPASWLEQLAAFALFRLFDIAKPGPVGWADAHFKAHPGEAIGWRHGFGILIDDAVAALCTLVIIALWKI